MTSADRLLEGLDPEQRQVAEALRGPVRVLAGAGTGKTRAITHRIAYGVAAGVYNPSEVLAVTFTARAAGEMRTRLRALGAPGVQARTFHAAALRQLRYFWPKVYGGEPPELTASKIPVVAGAARRNRLEVDQARLRDLASEIEWSKVTNVRPDDYERMAPLRGREVSGLTAGEVAHVFSTYEELKREQGRMDMEDVLLIAAALLAEDDRVSAQVRSQYKWFVVDEFQDVSPIQAALLDLWLGGRDELCVVGDPAQTIYSFAGARAAYLSEFSGKYPATTSIELVRNYRSTPQVIAAANTLLKGTATGSVQLRAQQPAGAELTWYEATDEVAEADAVAAEVARLLAAGTPLREMAVLFRINAQSETFEEALTARSIPYVVRGAARFFERPEVRQALALLRASARAGEAASDGLLDQVRGVLGGMGWSTEPPAARGQARDRWESLMALVSQAEEYGTAELAPTLEGFVAELDRRATEQHAPVAEGVTLATLHTAKGLEWDAVFLAGMQEGSMPITYADTPAAVEEERRLLYVGITRARKHLMLSWSLARNPGGQARRKPSRFLSGLRPESVMDRPAAAASSARSKRRAKASTCKLCQRPLASARERNRGFCGECPIPYDEDVFESLKAWRRGRVEIESAEAEKPVPAFVIFSDAVLEALAEVVPTTRQAMLGIPGIGPAKLEKYGDELLAVLAEKKSE
ncbi:ATP-dependent DNA helicase UvrD2 [Nocardioides marmoriginsengisoli]|uniref:DNA 3'-5' helicase n=1 Tax=Nocardioides marmoriginsengisoli TaxID=661483 RepID=A0A3N0CD58_9ACTN|nr:ATP-dependent DNA helicase UvrD2 [Nocardioides marmoriginsengisoli]RNL61375.1 ATP-dependent DNA helicase UvrD2 [Nocardioides marmoriginsengisoli]